MGKRSKALKRLLNKAAGTKPPIEEDDEWVIPAKKTQPAPEPEVKAKAPKKAVAMDFPSGNVADIQPHSIFQTPTNANATKDWWEGAKV